MAKLTSTTETTPAPVTGKRKRNQVSYVADDYFDELDLDEEEGVNDEEGDDAVFSEDDDSFGPAKVRNFLDLRCNAFC